MRARKARIRKENKKQLRTQSQALSHTASTPRRRLFLDIQRKARQGEARSDRGSRTGVGEANTRERTEHKRNVRGRLRRARLGHDGAKSIKRNSERIWKERAGKRAQRVGRVEGRRIAARFGLGSPEPQPGSVWARASCQHCAALNAISGPEARAPWGKAGHTESSNGHSPSPSADGMH